VQNNRYSGPVRLIGRQLRALLHANRIEIYAGRTLTVRHERFMGKDGSQLEVLPHRLTRRTALQATSAFI